MSYRYKELTKLINAGVPLYYGVVLLIVAGYGIIQATRFLIYGSKMGPWGYVLVYGISCLVILLGVVLIKVGVESKNRGELKG